MERYYFLFAMALVWMIFACIQDLRKREVSNWLNFSLLSFALAYRAFYSAIYDDWRFLILGIIGFLIFSVIANAFYYTKVFGGGDAKLLIALGAILPFESYWDLLYISLAFLVILSLVGAVYSLIYSIFLVSRNWAGFKSEFSRNYKKQRALVFISAGLGLILSFFSERAGFKLFIFLFFLLMPFLYFYLRSVESRCMLKMMNARDLTEGDWLEREVKVGRHWVRKSVHGLSLEQIRMLRIAHKRVLIKEGIPFQPAFLIAFLIMVFAFLFLSRDLLGLLSSLLLAL